MSSKEDIRGRAIVEANRLEMSMGIFKSLSDVPSHLRLENYDKILAGKDPFDEWIAENDFAESTLSHYHRFFSRWKQQADSHYCLARPEEAEEFAEWLLGEYSSDWAARHYEVIETFYRWMEWHADYPHSYNPLRMAANQENSFAKQLWIHSQEKQLRYE